MVQVRVQNFRPTLIFALSLMFHSTGILRRKIEKQQQNVRQLSQRTRFQIQTRKERSHIWLGRRCSWNEGRWKETNCVPTWNGVSFLFHFIFPHQSSINCNFVSGMARKDLHQ